MAETRYRRRKKSKFPIVMRLSLALLAVAMIVVCVFLPDDWLQPQEAVDAPAASDPAAQTETALTRAGIDAAPAVGKIAEASISIGGDILIHTPVFKAAQSGDGYDFTPFFSDFKGYFKGDMNIVNMEVPVDALGGNSGISSYPAFNTPHEILDAVKSIGVDTLFNSNNHALDKGFDGLVKSRSNILDAGLDAIGTYRDEEEHDTPFIKSLNGIKIGIAAYTDSTNGIPIRNSYSLNKIDLDMSCVPEILGDVDELRSAGAEFVMVSLHWGAEYQDAPAQIQRDIAAGLADGGVDAIIGNHAHCVQPIERIGETLVVYSLGNFFADQTPLNRAKTQESMVVTLKVARDAEGVISLADASYMPTFTYRVSGKSGAGTYRLLPAGKYAEAASRPDVFSNDADWKKCKNAWNRVREIVGDEISATME
jgi:poly-gamma-glutamate synthesis protein (capsule biosynthesis protein)